MNIIFSFEYVLNKNAIKLTLKRPPLPPLPTLSHNPKYPLQNNLPKKHEPPTHSRPPRLSITVQPWKNFNFIFVCSYQRNSDHNFLDDFPSSIEQLWIDLYERGFVEVEDVHLVQLWLRALKLVGYRFPGNSTVLPETSITGEQMSLLSVGKTMKHLSRDSMDKRYNQMTYLTSTCSLDTAGSLKLNMLSLKCNLT